MKTKLNLFQARLFCAVAVGMGSSFRLAAVAEDPVRIDAAFSDANWISMGGILGANGPVRATVMDVLSALFTAVRKNVKIPCYSSTPFLL